MFFSKLKKWALRLTQLATLLMSVVVLLLVVYRFGFPLSLYDIALVSKAFEVLLICQWVGITLKFILDNDSNKKNAGWFRTILYVFFTIIAIAMISLHFDLLQNDKFLNGITSIWSIVVTSALIAAFELSAAITNVLGKKTNPTAIIAVSFAMVIFIGSLLLGLPNCSYKGLDYIDALFVSASAVCVTGLTPINVATELTQTGQVVMLMLIQVGGLGIMTLTSFFGLFFVSSSFSNQIVVKDLLNSDKMNGLLKYALRIIIVTITVETIGAIFIYLAMIDSGTMSHSDTIFFSVFHAVSAFCNAGFSTLSGNLYDPQVRDIASVIWTVSWLVVFGGIGFPIFNNLILFVGLKIKNFFRKIFGLRKKVHKHIWALNSYIVVKTTAVLLLFGWVFFLVVEWNNALSQYDIWDKLAQGFLMAVTPRTAGFNGVNIGAMLPASIFVTMILMWIGGAPQSTAGGIKVTTLYLAIRNIMSNSKMHSRVEVKGREIPQESIRRALGVIVASLIIISVAVVSVSILEPQIDLIKVIFEVVSAIGTVGMTIGITPELSDPSKVIIILLMFVGRVGIVSILLTVLKRNVKPKHYSLPEENILIN